MVKLWKRPDEEWVPVVGVAEEFLESAEEEEECEDGEDDDNNGREWQARRNRLLVALAIVLTHECVH